jgi:hypothetical protein
MRLPLAAAIASLVLGLLDLAGQTALVQSPQTYSITLTHADIEHVVQALQQQVHVPVCFEMEDIDPKTQGITAREKLQEVKDWGDKGGELAMWEKIAKDTPDSICDWKLARYDFKIDNETAGEVVHSLLDKFTNYSYRFDNSYLIIRPKKSILDFEVDAPAITDKQPEDAIGALCASLTKKNLTLCGPAYSFGPPTISHVTMAAARNQNFANYLTSLCEASRPPTIWFVGGMKGSRIVTLTPAPQALGR